MFFTSVFLVKVHPQPERARAHRKKNKKKNGFSFLRPSTVLPLRALCAIKISDSGKYSTRAPLLRGVGKVRLNSPQLRLSNI